MLVKAEMTGVAAILEDGLQMFERATTAGMKDATTGLKEELRDQVAAAGLGNRLAYTWQGNVYPRQGTSLEPAGYVYSKAPKIISIYATGGVIRPVNGSNYLWIPTDNVPVSHTHKGGYSRRGGKPRMTPEEVQDHFNAELFVRRGKNGNFVALINVVRALSRRRPGFRQGTKRRAAAGRAVEPVLMFTLTRSVTVAKALDLEGAAQRWGARVPSLIEQNWRE